MSIVGALGLYIVWPNLSVLAEPSSRLAAQENCSGCRLCPKSSELLVSVVAVVSLVLVGGGVVD